MMPCQNQFKKHIIYSGIKHYPLIKSKKHYMVTRNNRMLVIKNYLLIRHIIINKK